MRKKVNKYKTNDYTFEYVVQKIKGKPYAIITGFYGLSEDLKNNGHLVVPAKIDKYNVYAVGGRALSNEYYIKEITFENGIEKLYTDACSHNDNLHTVNIPESMRSIGEYAFTYCPSLENVNISEGLERIDTGAFECTNLHEIKLPNSLRVIGSGAFKDTYLSSVHIGTNVEKICASAFSGCRCLENVTMSEGVNTIEDYAFKECASLKSIFIPKSVLCLEYGVFDSCRNLESIHIESNLINFDTRTDFAYGCNSLKTITFSETHPYLKVINGVLYDMSNKTLVRVPPAIDSDTVKVPGYIKNFADCCFDDVVLKKLIIKSKNINGLNKSNLQEIEEICYVPGSETEKALLSYKCENIYYEGEMKLSPIKTDVSIFLEELTENSIEKDS